MTERIVRVHFTETEMVVWYIFSLRLSGIEENEREREWKKLSVSHHSTSKSTTIISKSCHSNVSPSTANKIYSKDLINGHACVCVLILGSLSFRMFVDSIAAVCLNVSRVWLNILIKDMWMSHSCYLKWWNSEAGKKATAEARFALKPEWDRRQKKDVLIKVYHIRIHVSLEEKMFVWERFQREEREWNR